MVLAFYRQKAPYLSDNVEARVTAFHCAESITRQPVLGVNDLANHGARHRIHRTQARESSSGHHSDPNAVAASYSCRLDPGRYGLASTTSVQSYVATMDAPTVRLLAEDAALRHIDNLEAFAITAVGEPPERVAANSDRRRPGRVDDITPTLIPLLRGNAAARGSFDDNYANNLRPLIGIIASLKLAAVIWGGVITFAIWCYLWR